MVFRVLLIAKYLESPVYRFRASVPVVASAKLVIFWEFSEIEAVGAVIACNFVVLA